MMTYQEMMKEIERAISMFANQNPGSNLASRDACRELATKIADALDEADFDRSEKEDSFPYAF